MAQHTQDEGFHEIQLNGKQLVFLFMAATVVSVVIFLCGVLVGRGVRSQVANAPDNAALNSLGETSPTQPAAPVPTPTTGADPRAAAPPAADELTYFNRLEKQNPPAEQLKAAPDRKAAAEKPAAAAPPASPPVNLPKEPARAPAPAPTPAAAPPPAPAQPAAAATVGEPTGQGFAVQIAALNERGEAETIAKRLSSKGYAAYVMTPSAGSPSVFRVRVGKFGTRREAETVAARLQKEEQFKPWVTR